MKIKSQKLNADQLLDEIKDFIRANPKYRYMASNLTMIRLQLEHWENDTNCDVKQLDKYFTKTGGKFSIPLLNKYL